MKSVSSAALAACCDHSLKPAGFNDWEAVVNGLQVQNAGTVTRIAPAVDASLATVNMAIAAKADWLLVHHGLVWGGSRPWTGRRYELLCRLLDENLAVHSSHLLLDAHPRLGNSAHLCTALGWRKRSVVLPGKGLLLECSGSRSGLARCWASRHSCCRADRAALEAAFVQVLQLAHEFKLTGGDGVRGRERARGGAAGEPGGQRQAGVAPDGGGHQPAGGGGDGGDRGQRFP